MSQPATEDLGSQLSSRQVSPMFELQLGFFQGWLQLNVFQPIIVELWSRAAPATHQPGNLKLNSQVESKGEVMGLVQKKDNVFQPIVVELEPKLPCKKLDLKFGIMA